MACPITVTKFVGTVSLGLLTGLSYSMATVTIPSLRLLPTASQATRALKDAKRRARKHALRLANLANSCLLFAWLVSPRRRKHPYLIWVCLSSTLGSFGVDFWFNRDKGLAAWSRTLIEDIDVPFLTLKQKTAATPTKKDEDLVVVEAETDVNGESVERDMERERKLQRARTWFSGAALAMGIVGLWGDGA
ncbi:hypothetical protein VTN77DRAFT_2988 [Rasamsonia byssochlamydoides]|uniref:uncharacterized protein n=1 Tax=Rasamsonia byssochlamydoides TaxID=89139 RepID=UPI003742B950